MDRREELQNASVNRYQEDLKRLKEQDLENNATYIEEEGKRYRIPYKIIKKVEFFEISKEDMIDHPHAARLQYRLMLLDPVIKAFVEYTRGKITIIYNPAGAKNIREKMSLDEIIAFLAKEGVHVNRSNMVESDYDYYKEFYSYAFNPKVIREHAPYGYTKEQWKKMKPDWEKKMAQLQIEKNERYQNFKKRYESEHPDVYPNAAVDEENSKQNKKQKKGLFAKLAIFKSKN